MSLINCQECNKDMSDTLEACPHCGFKRTIIKPVEKPTLQFSSNNTICTACGEPYYKGAKKCPYCKTPNANRNVSFLKPSNTTCTSCGETYYKSASKCPYCKTPNINRTTTNDSATVVSIENPNQEIRPNMTKCIGCGKPYYKGARSCPYCKTKNMNKKTSYVVPAIIIGFIALMFIFAIIGYNSDTKSISDPSRIDITTRRLLENGEWDEAIQLLQSVTKTDQNYNLAQIKLRELQTGYYLFKQNYYWVCPLQNGETKIFDRDYYSNENVKIEGNTIYNKHTGDPLMRYVGYINNRSIEIMDVGLMEFVTRGSSSDNGKSFSCHIGKPSF